MGRFVTHAQAPAAHIAQASRPGSGVPDFSYPSCGNSDPGHPDGCCYAPKPSGSFSAL